MVSKKGLIVGLLVLAVFLSVFSLALSFSVDSLAPKGESRTDAEYAGNVNLVVLSNEAVASAPGAAG